MKIAILSRKSALYSTRRLREAGESRGHQVQVIDYVRCYMNITSHRPMVMYQGRTLEAFERLHHDARRDRAFDEDTPALGRHRKRQTIGRNDQDEARLQLGIFAP